MVEIHDNFIVLNTIFIYTLKYIFALYIYFINVILISFTSILVFLNIIANNTFVLRFILIYRVDTDCSKIFL
jgi:hypothetical protein